MIYPPEGTPKDWDGFHEACDQDKVIEEVANIFRILDDTGYFTIVTSGRMGHPSVRAKTEGWLRAHKLFPDMILMRRPDDYREDFIIKKEFLDKLRETYDICGVFEDRLSVC